MATGALRRVLRSCASVGLRGVSSSSASSSRAVYSCTPADLIAPPLRRLEASSPWRPVFASYATAVKEVSLTPEQQKRLTEEYEHVTGLEREEVEAELAGKNRFDSEVPLRGPFGTREAPFVVESEFDERTIGCSGGAGEEEHDVIWFKLPKDTLFECPLCGQAFKLKVVGEGGSPGGHH
eukprot:jgi/Chlat1/5772/Chrsp387S05505